jgi:haloacetate dehalogenase
MTDDLFEGFQSHRVPTRGGATIHARSGGSGPALLLLHGYPQTLAMWHRVIAPLARRFTVVAADLRGYGDSSGPEPLPDGANYTFREMADDQVELMRALGHQRFLLAAHDRGARTAHRLVLDHPEAVTRLALLDIQPTHYAWTQMSVQRLRSAWHWMLMSQPHDIPEVLLTSAPKAWLLERLLGRKVDVAMFDPRAYAEYLRCLTPAMIAASCADYRAFATLDVAHDQVDRDAGRRIGCPTLVLYGEHTYGPSDMAAIWGEYADDVRCRMVEGAGHHLAEEQPAVVLEELLGFLA